LSNRSSFQLPEHRTHSHGASTCSAGSLELRWIWIYCILGYEKHGSTAWIKDVTINRKVSKSAIAQWHCRRNTGLCKSVGTNKSLRAQKYPTASTSAKLLKLSPKIMHLQGFQRAFQDRKKLDRVVILVLLAVFRCQQSRSESWQLAAFRDPWVSVTCINKIHNHRPCSTSSCNLTVKQLICYLKWGTTHTSCKNYSTTKFYLQWERIGPYFS